MSLLGDIDVRGAAKVAVDEATTTLVPALAAQLQQALAGALEGLTVTVTITVARKPQ